MPPFKSLLHLFLLHHRGRCPRTGTINAGDKMRSVFASSVLSLGTSPFQWQSLTLSLGVKGFFCLNVPEGINKGAHAACQSSRYLLCFHSWSSCTTGLDTSLYLQRNPGKRREGDPAVRCWSCGRLLLAGKLRLCCLPAGPAGQLPVSTSYSHVGRKNILKSHPSLCTFQNQPNVSCQLLSMK